MKNGRVAEGRARMTPLGPELRFMIRRGDKSPDAQDLLWSMIFTPDNGGGGGLAQTADAKKREFVALGWVEDIDAFARHLATRVVG